MRLHELGVAILKDRFVLDEDGWAFRNEDPDALDATVKVFLDLLDYIVESGHGVARWSELWSIEAASGRTLADLLFSSELLDRDLRNLLGGKLDKIRCWDESGLGFSPALEVFCDGTIIQMAPGISIAHSAVVEGRAIACLTTNQTGRCGSVKVTESKSSEKDVYFLVEPYDARLFWRSLMELEEVDESRFESLAALAYPRIRFSDRVWSQLGRFEGSFRDIRPKLQGNLAGLSDYAPSVWRDHSEPHSIAAQMSATCGVNCSRESPKTHANVSAMATRLVEFADSVLECEWHAKLEPHRNRIHFTVLGGVVYVGIFHKHLSV